MNILLSISVCFLVIFACSPGLGLEVEDPPLKVTFQNATSVKAKPGTENITFRCEVNRPLIYLVSNVINIVHLNPVTSKETIITINGNVNGETSECYTVAIEYLSESHFYVFFNISKVRYRDDGMFRCRARTGPDIFAPTEEDFAEKEVVVLMPVTSLKIKLGDFLAYGKSKKDQLLIKPGVYDVSCIAEGSNPGTKNVRMSFNGTVLSHSKPVITPMKGTERKFKTELRESVKFIVSQSGQELVCSAKDSTGQSKYIKRIVKVNKTVKVKTPEDGNGADGGDSSRARDRSDPKNSADHRVNKVSDICLQLCVAVFWLYH